MFKGAVCLLISVMDHDCNPHPQHVIKPFTMHCYSHSGLTPTVFVHSVSDQSRAERSNSIAVAGAVMGAVLALFLIAVFIIVIVTARKAPPPASSDKV